ncbi:MAG: hypothetical protein LUG52_06015 [Clostridia bacterium]|nr:hypothetical protein [Clostridia bacterium]
MNNTKKLLTTILCIAMILSSIGCSAAEDSADAIFVTIDGTALTFDANPYITNGRTMVPMRAIFEALDCDVTWNNDEKSVTAVSDATTVKLAIGEATMYVNNTAVTLDQAAEITSDRTFVPVRAVSEALGCDVNWNNDTRTVEITSSKVAVTFERKYDDSGYEYAVITALNRNNNITWEYETAHYERTELDRVNQIGLINGNYYLNEAGIIICFDILSGAVLWINNDFQGSIQGIATDGSVIYLCGYYGPDFYAVSCDGETIYRIEQFYENYCWACEIELSDNIATVYMHGGDAEWDNPVSVYVDLSTGVYSLQKISYSSSTTYDVILESYYTALSENWDMQQLSASELCYLCYDYDISEVGYTFIDINGDGISELLIGEVDAEDDYIGMFFDLYTIIDGNAVLVASSAERDRYYLCSNNLISNEGSGGASLSSNYFYSFSESGNLSFIEAVIYDESIDEKNPWFYCTTVTESKYGSYCSQEDYISISKNEAQKIINSYTHTAMQFISFSEYSL